MKIVKKDNVKEIKNSDTSSLLEYSIELNDKDMDFAINIITGRYPEKGYAVNEECKELVYVLNGTGTLNTRNESTSFSQGDVLLIDKGEHYYWNGNCKIIMVCNPAWYKEQCKLLD